MIERSNMKLCQHKSMSKDKLFVRNESMIVLYLFCTVYHHNTSNAMDWQLSLACVYCK